MPKVKFWAKHQNFGLVKLDHEPQKAASSTFKKLDRRSSGETKIVHQRNSTSY
jgi:hypothetical protein